MDANHRLGGKRYDYEEDLGGLGLHYDIIDADGDLIATVGSRYEARMLVLHLNHPQGRYVVLDRPELHSLRWAIFLEDGNEAIAAFPHKEIADGILSHLNRHTS